MSSCPLSFVHCLPLDLFKRLQTIALVHCSYTVNCGNQMLNIMFKNNLIIINCLHVNGNQYLFESHTKDGCPKKSNRSIEK